LRGSVFARACVSVAIFDCTRKQNPHCRLCFTRCALGWSRTSEVVAKDSNAVVLERLPLALDFPDLPSLCYQLMDEFRDNRVYSTDVLNLEFRYKQAA